MTTKAWYLVLAASVVAMGLAACEVTVGDGEEGGNNGKGKTPPIEPGGDCEKTCDETSCGTEMTTCKGDDDCLAAWSCANDCPDNDNWEACYNACADEEGNFSTEFEAMMTCYDTNYNTIDTCKKACSPTTGPTHDECVDSCYKASCQSSMDTCRADQDCSDAWDEADECEDDPNDPNAYSDCIDDIANNAFSSEFDDLLECLTTNDSAISTCAAACPPLRHRSLP